MFRMVLSSRLDDLWGQIDRNTLPVTEFQLKNRVVVNCEN